MGRAAQGMQEAARQAAAPTLRQVAAQLLAWAAGTEDVRAVAAAAEAAAAAQAQAEAEAEAEAQAEAEAEAAAGLAAVEAEAAAAEADATSMATAAAMVEAAEAALYAADRSGRAVLSSGGDNEQTAEATAADVALASWGAEGSAGEATVQAAVAVT